MRQRVTQLERELAEAEERERMYRDLVEHLPIGVYRTTSDGKILLANAAVVKMLGFRSFSELAARNLECGAYEPNYSRAQFRERIMRDGEIRGLESVWTTHDGRELLVRENARVVMGRDGSTVYEGTVEDCTETRRREEELRAKAEFLEEVVTNASVGIFVLDEEGNYVLINPECGRIVGRWPGDHVGRRAGLHIHPDDQTKALSQFLLALGGEQIEFTTRIQSADGSYRHCHVNLSPVKLMGRAHVLGVVTDVTDRRSLEEALVKRRGSDLHIVLISALPLLSARLTEAELEHALEVFEKEFEARTRQLHVENLRRMEEYENGDVKDRSEPARVLKRYLLYISSLFGNIDVRAESSLSGSGGRLELHHCGWLQDAKRSPLLCRLCEVILKRTFEWTGLGGEVRPITTIARGAGCCRFDFELRA
ncbi:MAG: PAS domain S-box protein [Thermoplasmata archaeon]